MVPFALGQKVEFKKNQGPILGNFNLNKFLSNNKKSFTQKLQPVYKAIEITRKKLNKEKSLISFIGAPWTLLIYMFGIKKNKNEIDYKKIQEQQSEINIILDKLNEYLCVHIENQINSGADVVQIFDSWAGLLPTKDLPKYCYVPNLRIVEFCKKKKCLLFVFPRVLKSATKNLIM